jgi:acetyl esterase/lipase
MPAPPTWSESEDLTMLCNVARPTITPVLPELAAACDTGVLVCPGGGYFMLAIAHEGFEIARWFADRGVPAFVLTYRVLETPGSDDEMMAMLAGLADDESDGATSLSSTLRRMDEFAAIPLADAVAAMRLVRDRASEWGVRDDRVGAVGFSAGARLTLELGMLADRDVRPAFLAAIYPPPIDLVVPPDAPPLFVAAAADDPIFDGAVQAHAAWCGAGRAVEAHLYARGGHGFGSRTQGATSDRWIEQFWQWLTAEGFGPGANAVTRTHGDERAGVGR